MMKRITQNLYKRLRYMVLSEGSRAPTTGTEIPIVLGLWSSYAIGSSFFRQSTAWTLAVICCIHSKMFRVTIAMQ